MRHLGSHCDLEESMSASSLVLLTVVACMTCGGAVAWAIMAIAAKIQIRAFAGEEM